MAAKRSVKSGSRNKREATTAPVKLVSELVAHWDRDFAISGVELTGGYRGLMVEVVGRTDNVISFNVLDAKGAPIKKVKAGEGAFSINLDDGLQAWSALPSTAQDVDPESSQRVGYLFVTPDWISRNKIAMDGPKWPRGTSI
jgi:hypothetical protein